MNKLNKSTKPAPRWGNFLLGILIGGAAVYGPLLFSAVSNSQDDGAGQRNDKPLVDPPVGPQLNPQLDSPSQPDAKDKSPAISDLVPEPLKVLDQPDFAVLPTSEPLTSEPPGSKEVKVLDDNSHAKDVAMEVPQYRGLDSNLYMQTSAEYRACCLQAYRWAKRVIHDKVISRVAKESLDPQAEKPPAVVLDLDETVLDNRQFQTRQIREGWAYNTDYWAQWEADGSNEVGVIPGAVEFIQHLQTLGIQPVYITNRNVRSQEQTLAALERFGISVPTELLLCADANTKSNKDSRRQLIREKFDVLMFVGDNLRDFDNMFKDDESLVDSGLRIDARNAKVDQQASKFGTDWILLPNPAYGEWQKPLEKGVDAAKQLEPRIKW